MAGFLMDGGGLEGCLLGLDSRKVLKFWDNVCFGMDGYIEL